MIAIFITFFSALFLLFFGLNKSEKDLKPIASVLLLAASLLLYFDYKNWLHFDGLFGWMPSGMIVFESNAKLFTIILTFIASVIVALFPSSERKGFDIIGLMMFSLCGGGLMIGSQHLIILFLGIEVLSIPLYVLAGSDKDSLSGNEAALKYFLMGAFSTAIFLLGAAFLYGGSGSLYYNDILTRLSFAEHFGEFPVLIKTGLALVSVGLLFKVSAVPFHFWSPDVYEGSPNRIAAFMAIIVKTAGFAAFAHLLMAFAPMQTWYSSWILPLAVLTIIGGNIIALVQHSFKRMLAYSSISHAGYLLLFLLQPIEPNLNVLIVYLLSYGLGTAILFYLFDKYNKEEQNSFLIFQNLHERNRLDSWALVVAIFTIAGIPSTIGFIAKYQLFAAVLPFTTWGILFALVGSAISIAYYFKPFRVVFKSIPKENESEKTITTPFANRVVLLVLIGIIGLFGLLPNTWNILF